MHKHKCVHVSYFVSSQQEDTMLPPAGLFHELGNVIIHVYVSPLYVYLPTGVKVKHVVL